MFVNIRIKSVSSSIIRNSVVYLKLIVIYFSLVLTISANSSKTAVSIEHSQGFHVTIVKHISKELELDVEVLNAHLGRRLHMLKVGQLDLLVGLRKTPQRESDFIFIEPGYTIGRAVSEFYINSNTTSFFDDKESSRKRLIAVTTGSKYIQDYDIKFPYEIIKVVSLDQAIKRLWIFALSNSLF